MDTPLQFTGGPLPDLRVKQERMESPAPSCLSVKSEMSMDTPLQFTGGTLPDLRVLKRRMESPAPSCLSVKSEMSMDPPLQFTGGPLPDLRVKQERMESPAPSCLSVKSEMSMDTPLQFTGGTLPDLRVLKRRMESPAPSCLSVKSEMSMDPPLQFTGGPLPDLRVKQERMEPPAPSCLSVKSEMSMDTPLKFRDGSLYDISASLLTEDQFRCSVCSEALREPVSIPCGHSYCRQCISTYWAQPSLEGYYVCPECSKRFCTLPELSINTALARVLQAFQQSGYSPALPAQTYARAGDVPCDLCPGPKHRAVKSCLTCSASYCEGHVRQHYTVPALQRHLLAEVRGDQTHTDQPDRTMKMEDLKEEETMEVETEEETEKAKSFSTCTQLWKIESERECSRVKQERMDSPAPSCLSVKSEMSMDTPLQFTGGTLPDLRVLKRRMESPAPSCLSVKSEMSMDTPLQFTGGPLPDLRVKQERMESPAPSCLSVKSEMSMDPPLQFRDGSLYDISASLLTEDQFRCSVCSEALMEPVSIPCGHSYCRQCISTYWAQPSLEGYYVCPECSKRFCTLPELSINTALARVLQAFQQAGYSPALPAQTYAGAGDVPCDLCPGPKHRAVKSCLTCSASYCEGHVRQHYTVPALQRHLLAEVRGDQTHTDQPDRTMKMEDLKEGHEHKMEEGLDDESNSQAAAATQSPGDSRRLSIQRCIQSLVHACQCRNANCSLPSCQKMKRVVQHTKGCKRKTSGGCPICKQLIALCCYHAKHCQENKCPVPFCLNIKHKLRQQQLQHRLQQAQMLRRRIASMQRVGQPAGGGGPVGGLPSPGNNGTTAPSTPTSVGTQPPTPQTPTQPSSLPPGPQPGMGPSPGAGPQQGQLQQGQQGGGMPPQHHMHHQFQQQMQQGGGGMMSSPQQQQQQQMMPQVQQQQNQNQAPNPQQLQHPNSLPPYANRPPGSSPLHPQSQGKPGLGPATPPQQQPQATQQQPTPGQVSMPGQQQQPQSGPPPAAVEIAMKIQQVADAQRKMALQRQAAQAAGMMVLQFI
ncbi:uncharacterized protein [Osmerus mordax]|uniref:uncharacterized protein n=1 Tax=Osmerus mordax TaxID=8014 RepID=UPI00351007D3